MFNFSQRSWSWGRFVFLFAYHHGYLMIDGKGRPCAFILLCQFLQKSRNYISRKNLNKYWWKALLNTLKRWLPWNKSQNCIKCLEASSPSKQRNRDYLVPSLFLFCPLYFIFYLFWIGGYLLYNVVLVSAIQQCESMWISHIMYTYVPSLWSPPLTQPPTIPSLFIITGHWAELPVLNNNFPLAIDFTHGSIYIYISMLLPQFIPPLHPPLCPQSVLYICISILLLMWVFSSFIEV